FFGWKYQWPSALLLYWFATNVLQMGQQMFMLRRYHEPLSFIDSAHVITEDVPPEVLAPAANGKKAIASGNGSRKAKNKKTKGARS
ncbi:MAG TPA: hypothetical protein VGN11_08645, partial [Candidatus Baltobacteraceae bacterium]|nr:hypothetical protein [Candidatus Baltobacteraceae bacterium]